MIEIGANLLGAIAIIATAVVLVVALVVWLIRGTEINW